MSIGMHADRRRALLMLAILLFVPGDYAGPCFIGFAIGESLGAAALRIAGGIFTKIADIGSDLMKIVFNIKEDDARNPGVIADCTGDNAGDSVGPTADGFETYGVTGVALITFILLAVQRPAVQVQLLVWIFVMRIVMVVASRLSYFINEYIAKAKYGNADKMNFEHPLTTLVWLTSIVSSPDLPHLLPPDPDLGGDGTPVVEALLIISCGTLAGAIIPETRQGLHLDRVGHVREVVTARGGRRVAQRALRPHRRQLLGLLDGHRHRGAHGHRLRRVDHDSRPLITFGSHGEISGFMLAAPRSSPSAWWPSASSAWAR
jgi:K(+)-stimulated pyrophosphate-energized sodium pump